MCKSALKIGCTSNLNLTAGGKRVHIMQQNIALNVDTHIIFGGSVSRNSNLN